MEGWDGPWEREIRLFCTARTASSTTLQICGRTVRNFTVIRYTYMAASCWSMLLRTLAVTQQLHYFYKHVSNTPAVHIPYCPQTHSPAHDRCTLSWQRLHWTGSLLQGVCTYAPEWNMELVWWTVALWIQLTLDCRGVSSIAQLLLVVSVKKRVYI